MAEKRGKAEDDVRIACPEVVFAFIQARKVVWDKICLAKEGIALDSLVEAVERETGTRMAGLGVTLEEHVAQLEEYKHVEIVDGIVRRRQNERG